MLNKFLSKIREPILILSYVFVLGLATHTVLAAPQYSVQQTILPAADSTYDLGTSTARWRNLYVTGCTGCGGVNYFTNVLASTTLNTGSELRSGTFVGTSTATSTLAGGLNLSATGCYAISGKCLGSSSGAGGSDGQLQYNSSGTLAGISGSAVTGSTISLSGNAEFGNTGDGGTQVGSNGEPYGIRRNDGVDPLEIGYNDTLPGRGARFFGGAGNYGTLKLMNNEVQIASMDTSNGTYTFRTNGGFSLNGLTQQSGLLPLLSVASSSSANLFTVLGNGKIGIGTSSPFNLLSVAGTSSANLFQFNGGNVFGFASTTNLWIFSTPTTTSATGGNNVFIGRTGNANVPAPGSQLTTGNSNIGIGTNALSAMKSGTNNIGIGTNACGGVVGFSSDTCIGTNAGQNVNASNVIFIGANAGNNATSSGAASTVLIGANSGRSLAGSNNVFIGQNSGGSSASLYNSTSFSTIIGASAGQGARDALDSSFFGALSGQGVTTGQENTLLGVSSGNQLTVESNNTFVGSNAGVFVGGLSNGGGTDNTCLGFGCLANNTNILSTLSFNAAVGEASLSYLDTGTANSALGYNTGQSLTDGSDNIFIGQNVDALTATQSNGLNIGNVIFGTGMYGGNIPSATPATGGAIGIGTTTLVGGLLNLGFDNGGTASTTIAAGKIQWDGRDSGGTHRCFFFDASGNITHSNGACIK